MKTIFSILFFSASLLYSQNIREIDSRNKMSDQLILAGKRDEAKKKIDSTIQYSKEIQYTKGLIYAYRQKSYILYIERDYYNSIKYAETALQENLSKITYSQQADLYHILGQNFFMLKMDDHAIRQYKKMILAAQLISDKKNALYHESVAYHDLATISWNLKKDEDSAYYYCSKVYKTLQNSSLDDKLTILLAKVKFTMALLQSKRGRKDSAEYYMKNKVQIPEKINNSSESSMLLTHLAAIKLAQGETEKAEQIKNKLNIISLKTKDPNDLKKLSEIEQIISLEKRDTLKAYESLLRYDSLDTVDEIKIARSYNHFVQDKDENIYKQSKKSKYLLGSIICIILLFMYSTYRFCLYSRKKNKEKKELLSEKEDIILQLENKANLSFDEIVELAKNNSPNFITRFQEVYPDFCKQVRKLDPDIQASELTFCAFLKLNFSTKDISNYTFVAQRTVQVRKSRLRKKFNISSDTDIYLWIQNLDKTA
ncbi:hypothetical protein [uncultured Chryseobacterium sp.]|uniref:hypothetical protein n=1 Tax=uncultured Chryseobacterium sp. TaxID=259322 RepID=UPI003748F61E